MIDKETLQDLAKELKIDYFTVSREYLQLLFLKYFYSQKESEKVYFKGGTALRFLFSSFRFSEDLDFTSLLTKSKLKILINKTLQDLKKEVGEILFQEEKTIADAFTGRIFQKIKEFNFPLTIRLDFSLREKPFLTESSYLETVFPIGPFPQVSHLKIEELMAEKIRAILTRNKGRDIFDFYFLLSKQVPIDWKLVNKKMALYQKTADPNQLIKAITDFPQEEIKNDLTKFLPLTHRDLVGKIKELTLNKLKML
jgi:predicted nucleotidyltransferase component of viral defense system